MFAAYILGLTILKKIDECSLISIWYSFVRATRGHYIYSALQKANMPQREQLPVDPTRQSVHTV